MEDRRGELPLMLKAEKKETHELIHVFDGLTHPEYENLGLGISYVQIENRTFILAISLLLAQDDGSPKPHQLRVPIHFSGNPQVRVAEMQDGSIKFTALTSNIRENLLQFATVAIDKDGTVHIKEGKEYTFSPGLIKQKRKNSLPKILAKRHE